jgi:hypothetical protein
MALALALLTMLGVLAAHTALGSRAPTTGVVLAATELRLSSANPAGPSVSWGARPVSLTDASATWWHVTKVKRAATRVGHRSARRLTVLLPATVVTPLGTVTAHSACDRTGDRRPGLARTGVGHPRRAPPLEAA